MRYSSVPDFLELEEYMKNQDREGRDNADAYTTIGIFAMGCSMILIDIIWM